MTGTPYYQDDAVTIYHGDCREIDAWLTCDVLVTDPPYGINAEQKSGTYRGAGSQNRYVSPLAGDSDTSTRDVAIALWGDKPRIVFGSWRKPRPEPVNHRLIWHKRGSVFGIANAAFISQDEEIYVTGSGFVKSSPPMRSVIATDEPRGGANGEASLIGHPTPKPISLMVRLIERCPPGVIADPFAGSGSTLRAAKDLGRKAIGIEIDERYCEIAARRMGQEVFDFGSAS